jgi:hypothetical protein
MNSKPFKKNPMLSRVPRLMAAALLTFQFAVVSTGAFAQNNDQKPPDQKPATGERKEALPGRAEEIAEVGRLVEGPAGNAECVFLGRRVISLLWRDDLDTAFRHLDLYDRFGCPGGHIQATFRCMVRLPDSDAKVAEQKGVDPVAARTDALNARIRACWINPSLQAQAPAALPAATAATPSETGTTNR